MVAVMKKHQFQTFPARIIKPGAFLALCFLIMPVVWGRSADVSLKTTRSEGGDSQKADDSQPEDINKKLQALPNGFGWFTYMLTSSGWQGGGHRLAQNWLWGDVVNPNAEKLAPQSSVLILGDTTGLQLPGLEAFVRAGGTLLVASDSKLWRGRDGVGLAIESLLGEKAQITGEKIRAFGRNAGYQTNPKLVPILGDSDFPWFKPRSQLAGPMLAKSLVANAPSRIEGSPSSGKVVARYEGMVELMPSGPQEEGAIFAVVAQLQPPEGLGRVVLMADPEVFCNQMLAVSDNLAFACNLAEWITTDNLAKNQARRDQLLLVVNGQIIEKPFVPPMAMPDMPLPNMPKEDLFTLLYRLAEGAVQAGEVLVSKVEDENIPDRAGSALARFLWPGPALVMLSVMAGFCLFLVLTKRTLNQDMAEVKKNG
jgi:hypothetical protein